MLLGNSDRLDEATKHQIYSDIYDDSEWLIGVVENLLSITRLNDGRLKFKFTDQLLDEVIAESLRHISRKHDDYKIVTDCEELVLARMDVRLIMLLGELAGVPWITLPLAEIDGAPLGVSLISACGTDAWLLELSKPLVQNR